jgi:ubiquinone/menaquinone biosynthesis C-methylase UbiE
MPSTNDPISDLYIRVRQKEGRLYPDRIVANLPSVPESDPLEKEWQLRAASLGRLTAYLNVLPRPIRLLDLGCGNGWFSRHLSSLRDVTVWGMDRNMVELTQAARLFSRPNLLLLNADIFQSPFPDEAFDIILLASVVQYFPDLGALIGKLRRLLRPRGEVHIIDSPFYRTADLPSAQERTRAYYSRLGFPAMADHYFHHSHAELEPFSPHCHYRPDAVQAQLSRLLGKPTSPFPWLSIC